MAGGIGKSSIYDPTFGSSNTGRESTAPVPVTGTVGNGRVSTAPVPFAGMTETAAGPAPYQYAYQEANNAPVQGVGMPIGGNPIPAADPGAGPGGGGGGGPAAPVQGGRQWYDQLGQQGQQDYQNQFLGGDADYNAQMGQYNQALNDFISRITNQKGQFQSDTNNAVSANTKNQGLSANQLGEDFGARGMSYSGLFDKSRNLLNDRYADQEKNIRQVGDRNMQDADNRLADFSNQNQIDQSNAKRAALGRMLQQQQLIDSGTTF